MFSDFILIDGLSVHCKIGWSKEERAFAQRLEIDLQIALSPTAPCAKQELDNTVCYDKVCTLINTLCLSKDWVLLEDLAEEIQQTLFEEFAIADELRIKIKKRIVPNTNWTGIELHRKRKNAGN